MLTAIFLLKNLNFDVEIPGDLREFVVFGRFWARRALPLTVKVVCMHDKSVLGVCMVGFRDNSWFWMQKFEF